MSENLTLSVSSQKTVKSCQQKYWHKKVAKTPVDKDYEEADSLGFGKAFHKVLETTFHSSWNETLLKEAMEEFKVDITDRPLLSRMLEKYTVFHKASGLKVVKCEMKIETPIYLGFIDFIAQGENGWWIGDNKTARMHDANIKNRLHKDPQVNMYAHFAEDIARALELKGPFLGFRYRQSIKTKDNATFEIVIPASALDPEGAWKNFLEAYEVVKDLHNGAAPQKNYGACYDYFRPCEFFSQCHGCLASEGHPDVKINTIETYNDADLLG